MLWQGGSERQAKPDQEIPPMHDLLIGLTFVLMVISPAIVAAFSGTSETNPE
jgi:hypothetical protein